MISAVDHRTFRRHVAIVTCSGLLAAALQAAPQVPPGPAADPVAPVRTALCALPAAPEGSPFGVLSREGSTLHCAFVELWLARRGSEGAWAQIGGHDGAPLVRIFQVLPMPETATLGAEQLVELLRAECIAAAAKEAREAREGPSVQRAIAGVQRDGTSLLLAAGQPDAWRVEFHAFVHEGRSYAVVVHGHLTDAGLEAALAHLLQGLVLHGVDGPDTPLSVRLRGHVFQLPAAHRIRSCQQPVAAVESVLVQALDWEADLCVVVPGSDEDAGVVAQANWRSILRGAAALVADGTSPDALGVPVLLPCSAGMAEGRLFAHDAEGRERTWNLLLHWGQDGRGIVVHQRWTASRSAAAASGIELLLGGAVPGTRDELQCFDGIAISLPEGLSFQRTRTTAPSLNSWWLRSDHLATAATQPVRGASMLVAGYRIDSSAELAGRAIHERIVHDILASCPGSQVVDIVGVEELRGLPSGWWAQGLRVGGEMLACIVTRELPRSREGDPSRTISAICPHPGALATPGAIAFLERRMRPSPSHLELGDCMIPLPHGSMARRTGDTVEIEAEGVSLRARRGLAQAKRTLLQWAARHHEPDAPEDSFSSVQQGGVEWLGASRSSEGLVERILARSAHGANTCVWLRHAEDEDSARRGAELLEGLRVGR